MAMVSWLRTRRSAITFDLGATGTRACQFQGRDGQFRLCDSLQLERPPSGETDQSAPPTVDPVKLDRLTGQGNFSGRDVALVLSPPDVQFFPLRLPDQALSQPPDRVQQALRFEVAQESRKPAEDLEVRYWFLPRGRGQHANVMAVVMSASQAARWCDLFARHRLCLRRIDVSPCALVRVAQYAWSPDDNDLWGVLDLGLRHTTLTVVVGTTLTYIRSLSVLAPQWTEQLSKALEVTYPVAEQLKRQHSLQPTQRGLRTGATTASLSQATDFSSALSSVLRGSLQTLAQEIGRCFSYVMQSFPDAGVKRLLLAGGGANFGGLAAVLEAQLGIPVASLAGSSAEPGTPAQPLASMHCEPGAAASLGGALLDLEAP
jgi:hypothetical protein